MAAPGLFTLRRLHNLAEWDREREARPNAALGNYLQATAQTFRPLSHGRVAAT
ncbi:MAG TPA: hypothetical protein VKA70_18445 [Blastocatellia bacterium]|nr:hypothetical protein [Blastocatellia bacterium]